MMPRRPCSLASALAGATFFAAFAGCKDAAKESATLAVRDVNAMAALIDNDVAEVDRGLPLGAAKLAPLVSDGAEPQKDVAGVRRALLRIRREVPDLDVAKSTFFALADPNGVAIRNDLEEDVMAGQNLFALFPALANADGGIVYTTGSFPNSATKNGPDKDWIAGTSVHRKDGSRGALLVTGWSYRYFARHLQEAMKTRLLDAAKARGDEGKLPVYYVAIFDPTGVYSAPLTPAVNEKALAEQGLVQKTEPHSGSATTSESGSFQGTVTIADRGFGVAARRTPKLAPDAGVVVLRSDF